jgi:hypothetical protein
MTLGDRRIVDEGHIRAGDQPGRPDPAVRDHLRAKLLLDLNRLLGRDIPGVEVPDLHIRALL